MWSFCWVEVLFFYSNKHSPIHVHIRNADGEAKYHEKTMKFLVNKGLKSEDLIISA